MGTMGQLLDAVEPGEQPLLTGQYNLTTMRLIDAACRSAEPGCSAKLSEVE